MSLQYMSLYDRIKKKQKNKIDATVRCFQDRQIRKELAIVIEHGMSENPVCSG